MTTSPRAAIALLLLVLCGLAGAAHAQAVRASGPHTQGNLTIFLIHGDDALNGDYLTLDEALEAETVRVHETGDVNELAVENVGTTPVFIQSGDIVKGGKQDRCIGTDFTLAPGSGKVKIAAFCVERGRWSQRAGESVVEFRSSDHAVSGRALKLAGNVNYADGGGQGMVWQEVQVAQQRLSSVSGAEVAATASPSSLQLTLENETVQEMVEKYITDLADAPRGRDDVIGYAAFINGEFNCADIYGSHALFTKLWPKQLRSIATEAAAESTDDGPTKTAAADLTPEAIVTQLTTAAQGKRSEAEVNEMTAVTTTESDATVSFETTTGTDKDLLRRSVISKD